MVLTWVQKNIGAFGGDGLKVTMSSASAGSINLSFLMLNPSFNLARAAVSSRPSKLISSTTITCVPDRSSSPASPQRSPSSTPYITKRNGRLSQLPFQRAITRLQLVTTPLTASAKRASRRSCRQATQYSLAQLVLEMLSLSSQCSMA